jgi:hypothetical protein
MTLLIRREGPDRAGREVGRAAALEMPRFLAYDELLDHRRQLGGPPRSTSLNPEGPHLPGRGRRFLPHARFSLVRIIRCFTSCPVSIATGPGHRRVEAGGQSSLEADG